MEPADTPLTRARMQLFCTYCGAKHIDKDWYAENPHKWHLCYTCGKKFWVPKASIGV